MQQFLKLVAEAYSRHEKEHLLDYCFIFPNKRSSAFFTRYLEEAMGGETFIMPAIMSMSDFVASLSDMVEASRYEQLFTLYNCYDRLSAEIADFDRFHFWGEMLLGDFNDVDSYLVDPARLFVNVKRLKEINSNYFTPEQIEIIKRYWGEMPENFDPDEFWRHVGADRDSASSRQFLKLWEILHPLYSDFHRALQRDGLTTRGRLYRDAVKAVGEREQLPFKRYIFVGFNVLSTSEIAIFEKLKARGLADFYWDYNSPAFEVPGNRASRFVARNRVLFPSRYTLDAEPVTGFPRINIAGIPSRVGQTKYAANVLTEWIEEGIIDNPDDAVNTAVVLPDEYLFIPLLHSLPPTVSNVNITMGYPMKHTSIATLVSSIVSMHLNSRIVRGAVRYFYEDILKVITHPLIAAIAGEETIRLSTFLTRRRLFTATAAELLEVAPSLNHLFKDVTDVKDFNQVYEYTAGLLAYLSRAVDSERSVEAMFLESYTSSLMALREAVRHYGITMRETTFFQLLERAVAGDTVRFVGQPLSGLQIMGMLETRSLDFDNIIMLSMNERIFPRKHYARSFIPETMRRAYGMSTTDFQESIYAYLFYRLISRARNVTLIYDARNIGGKNNEMSRYLAQLLYIYNRENVTHTVFNYSQISFNSPRVNVTKTPEVLEKLKLFTIPGSGKNLSASSINEYINCPLCFYLKYVEGYNTDNEIVDYMDSSTYGTVLHEVAEHLYTSLLPAGAPIPREGVLITLENIENFINSPVLIDSLIVKSINRHFYKRGDNDTTPLVGETELLGRVMKMFIIEMLKNEKQFVPFRFLGAEYRIQRMMEVNPELKVNIKQSIDRIDRVNVDRPDGGTLRVVDYKTGGDKLVAPSVAQIFDSADDQRCKAFVQLFFYCNAYAGFTIPPYPIQPVIYSFKSIKTTGIPPLKIGKSELTDFRDFNNDFLPRFNKVIEDIFNPEIPFTQALTDHSCTFCNFKQICSRSEQKSAY